MESKGNITGFRIGNTLNAGSLQYILQILHRLQLMQVHNSSHIMQVTRC
jgi:hypothetical protein